MKTEHRIIITGISDEEREELRAFGLWLEQRDDAPIRIVGHGRKRGVRVTPALVRFMRKATFEMADRGRIDVMAGGGDG